MGARVDDDSLDDLSPFERLGYVRVETEEAVYLLARNEYDDLERAITQKEEIFIGHDNRGLTILIRLRRGCALVVDGVIDWTPEALAEYHAEAAADKFRNGEG